MYVGTWPVWFIPAFTYLPERQLRSGLRFGYFVFFDILCLEQRRALLRSQ